MLPPIAEILIILYSSSLAVLSAPIRFDYVNPLVQTTPHPVQIQHNGALYYLAGHSHQSDGGNSHQHHEKKNSGVQEKTKAKKHFGSEGGNEREHHDAAYRADKERTAAKTSKGGKFSEKKGHKKGHKTKGWHNTFHRDEYHKEHRFYDDAHKHGTYDKHGAVYDSFRRGAHGQKNGGRHRDGYRQANYGKNGKYSKGHNEQAQSGYKNFQGDEAHHSNSESFGRQRKGKNGKIYGYKNGP